ncbi:hypothetical protein BCR32DRAFT_307394 [Anaeromyces robustus]|uniref:Uncharacterized protein n=1 Tax=Anaeromyces robustus TaxID=1754192 RepID=A0A1Y1XPI0_9FUNG|nr:hypothetical protein BCR32DRAFT_307394 [Anaeromyces robustus]|eukprot:ORX87641.1 hypothetical protein BCR32DRAFT_307394 [Anaeromyces robustus]
MSLRFNEEEKFDVTINGLHKHVQTEISQTNLNMDDSCEHISFSFSDMNHRKINFNIKEKTNKKSKPFNLLAPIDKTEIECFIDNKKVLVDKFSFPMNFQFRYNARYSNQCDLLEFANTDSSSLLEVELDDNNTYKNDNVEYNYEEPNSLSSIIVRLEERTIDIKFSPSFNMNKECDGSFIIQPEESMGYIEGIYSIKKEDHKIDIKLVPQKRWKSVPNSFITKMILNSNSLFCQWSKNYEFTEEIDIQNKLKPNGKTIISNYSF